MCAPQKSVIKEKIAIVVKNSKFQEFSFASCSAESEDTNDFMAAEEPNAAFNSAKPTPTFPTKCKPISYAINDNSKNKAVYKIKPPINGKKYSPIPIGNSFSKLKDALALSSSTINSSLSTSIALFTIKNQPEKKALSINKVVINNKIIASHVSGAFRAIPK